LEFWPHLLTQFAKKLHDDLACLMPYSVVWIREVGVLKYRNTMSYSCINRRRSLI
jgi:hypothetical protein